jgi:predicted MFS family arabinose efflux permease
MIVTALMGIGHLMLMASHQMLCVRASGPHTMESVFGNYMVAGAVGQAIGPYVVGWAGGSATMPPTQYLFGVGFVISIVALFVALAMRPGPEREHAEAQSELVPIGKLLRMPGLLTVVVAGVILVSGSDVVLIYVPLLGSERNIDVADIGLLLTVRAAASMVARLFYARMVEITGRWPLMIASTFTCACTFAALAAPLPLYWMHVVMALMGASFGLAATLSITIVVDMTTAGARATGNSLRIMSNRIGQFALPFGAGIVAAATGLAGLFLMLGGAMAVAGVALHWKKPAS